MARTSKKSSRRRSPTSSSSKRTFTLVDSSHKSHTKGGHYTGDPARAARKAAGIMFRRSKCKGSIVVQVRETTAGSNKKVKTYTVKRVPIDKTIEKGGKMIHIKNKYVVHAGGSLQHKPCSKRKSSRRSR